MKFESVDQTTNQEKAKAMVAEMRALVAQLEDVPERIADKLEDMLGRVEKVLSTETQEERISQFDWFKQGCGYLGEKLRGEKAGDLLIAKMDEMIAFSEKHLDVLPLKKPISSELKAKLDALRAKKNL